MFGSSPHRYLISRRIERAKCLLRSSDDSILEIGLAVGFATAASFSTAFRHVTGVSPRAYRRIPVNVSHGEVPTCVLMAWTRPVLEVSRNGKEFRAPLGWEVRYDIREPTWSWVVVARPGSSHPELILSSPGQPFMDASTAERVNELVAAGALSGGIVATDYCRADYEALKARGVEFHQEPMERDYGIDAAFRDPSGNSWRMTQRS